jgi:predicted acetyltransferase
VQPEIVVPGPDDFAAAMTPVWHSFGMVDLTAEALADERITFDASRPIAARLDGEWVAVAGDFPFQMTLPGGTTTPVAGVTMVGVAPTHRRQGLLTALMARQLDDVAGRGEMLAILTASESSIYGRFGYGPATARVETVVDSARTGFLVEPSAPGRCRLLTKADALPVVKAVYDSCRLQRAGAVNRDDWWWQLVEVDRPADRDGASALFFVVHEDAAGAADGFAVYRVRNNWVAGNLPRSALVVREVYGVTPEVEAALWRFLFDIDLVERVECWSRPLDDPLRWRLAEPRRIRTSGVSDWVWVRVVDARGALEARRYEGEGRLVLEIVDHFRPAAGGRFILEAGPEGAACKPTDQTPDLTLGATELGAVYLGGVAPSLLAQAGRADAHTPHALAQADALFTTALAPYANTGF